MFSFRYIFFILISVLFFSCENDIEKIKIITSKEKSPIESARNIEILYSDSGIVRTQIISPELNRYISDKPYLELPKGVKVLFFNDSMKVQSWLTANYAKKYEREKKMEAKNNVVVVNEKGDQLNTEHLIWDEQQEKIFSDAFVKITTADEIIYGDGLEANQNFTQYKIFNIKGTINLKEQNAKIP